MVQVWLWLIFLASVLVDRADEEIKSCEEP